VTGRPAPACLVASGKIQKEGAQKMFSVEQRADDHEAEVKKNLQEAGKKIHRGYAGGASALKGR